MHIPSQPTLQRIGVLAFLAAFLASCAMLPVPTRSGRIGDGGPLGSCADLFAWLDQRAADAQVLDPGAFRVQNYPYLRVNRFLASFREEAAERSAFAAWVDQMQALDQEGRKYEIANLPKAAGRTASPATDMDDLYGQVAVCGNLLRAADFQDIRHQEEFRKKVSAPDEYISLRRVFGLYPLTRIFVARGVENWQAQEHKTFSVEPPREWQTIRYAPEKYDDLQTDPGLIGHTQRDALGIPRYSPAVRDALFRMHAPVWEVQTQGDYDRIGMPVWGRSGVLAVVPRQSVTYTQLSFTRFGNETLTQLNYVIWFPERPKENAFDIYGGELDGVNFRVTLGSDGKALLYETIHNCGCYYEAYPTRRLRVREKIDYAEPPLILEAPEITPTKDFITVAMESGTHYVKHLYPTAREARSDVIAYLLADYGQLRSLADSEGRRRSMFGQDSIAPGSERLERFILWPTGVLSPGAMRQWGRHAVAFAGERHFDDPFFMDKMFEAAVSN